MATNLEFITSSEVTSSVTSYSLDNIFSADYDVYQIVLRNFKYVSGANWINLRFLDSVGSVISTANYDGAGLEMKAQTTFSSNQQTNSTSYFYCLYTNNNVGQGAVLTIYNPYDSGSYTFITQQDSTFITSVANYGHKSIGGLKNAGTHRGINLSSASNFDSGNISVFGVK